MDAPHGPDAAMDAPLGPDAAMDAPPGPDAALDAGLQEEQISDKQCIATLQKQITEQQEAYVLLHDRNLLLYIELNKEKQRIERLKECILSLLDALQCAWLNPTAPRAR